MSSATEQQARIAQLDRLRKTFFPEQGDCIIPKSMVPPEPFDLNAQGADTPEKLKQRLIELRQSATGKFCVLVSPMAHLVVLCEINAENKWELTYAFLYYSEDGSYIYARRISRLGQMKFDDAMKSSLELAATPLGERRPKRNEGFSK